MWPTYCRVCALLCLVVLDRTVLCDAVSNSQFNASLRDYSIHDESVNKSDVHTLQKEYQRQGNVGPITKRIRFKEVPDSALSSSSHSRGYLHHGHHAYGVVDYEEGPHYGYEYHFGDDHGPYDGHHHHDHHDHDHHLDHHDHHSHHDDHKHGHGYHHKYHDHALAAKSVLWPIAGIALLGAAAALVSNPVLLQLGVVSGRRRRDTNVPDSIPDFSKNHYNTKENTAQAKLNTFKVENKDSITKIRNKHVLERRGNKLRKQSNRVIPKLKAEITSPPQKIMKLSKYEKFYDKDFVPILQRENNENN
ncbi:hypothetical protein ACJJTC_009463 [Scirpophaga incertulas]